MVALVDEGNVVCGRASTRREIVPERAKCQDKACALNHLPGRRSSAAARVAGRRTAAIAGVSRYTVMTNVPASLHLAAIVSLSLAVACAITIALDVWRHPPKMAVMALVWPLTALFGSLVWLAIYYRWGRATRQDEDTPFAVSVLKGASHCGAGCTLGDIVAEGLALAVPAVAVWFGYGTLFGTRMVALWIPDFLFAFLFGIGFQYWSIVPMRQLSPGEGIRAALKADVLSIGAWQIGMYGGMALIQFLWFAPQFGGLAEPGQPEFWMAMQIAMLAGFCTSYPMNWLLVRNGVKEAM